MAKRTEAVNPDRDLTNGHVTNVSSPKQTGSKSGGRTEINPDMDLKKEGTSDANTGGPVPTSKRVAVNPDMDLTKESATGEGTAQEKEPAVMPGVGQMPTGKKAAGKSTQPE